MGKKFVVAIVVVLAILIALFLANGYPKGDQTVKPADDSIQGIEADLKQDVDTGASDFNKLDADIQKL